MKKACMIASYAKANDGSNDDAVLVNERVMDADGVERTNLRLIENFALDYYVSNVAMQKTHKQKKEFEGLEHLRKFSSTQAMKPMKVGKALGRHGKTWLGELKKSPYIYGLDLTPTVAIREAYRTKFPTYKPAANAAYLDFETNVYSSDGEIISGAVTYKDKHILALNKKWFGDDPDDVEKLYALYKREFKKDIKERGCKLYVKVCDNSMGVIRTLIGSLHKLKPDLVGIWGTGFDVPKMMEEMDRCGVDPAVVFSDPSVPKKYKYFKWIEDPQRKETAGGKVTSKHFADLWHKIYTMASFQFVDMMSFYKHHRVSESNAPNFKFDTICQIETGRGKLKIGADDSLPDIEWHKSMQKDYKIEYGIYNVFDCFGMELINEATGDLSYSLLTTSGISDIQKLFSGPSILADELHFARLKDGFVICTTAPNMTDEKLDRLTPSMKKWIATVSSKLINRKGADIYLDIEGVGTRIFKNCYDVDIKSGYPTVGVISNASVATKMREVCGIQGMDQMTQRQVGIDMTATRNNAILLGTQLYQLPTMGDLLSAYRAQR